MGIRRCPYCRALVEEDAFYCRNCGTQLLFPEDQDVAENRPGDKIFEKLDKREGVILEETELEEVNLEEMEEQENEEEKRAGKEKKEDGRSRQFRKKKQQEGKLEARLDKRKEEELMMDEEKEENLFDLEEEIEMTKQKESAEEVNKKTLDFPTAELDRLTRSVDEGQKKLEEFLEFLKEKASDQLAKESHELRGEEPMIAEEADLPPWAEAIKDRVEKESASLTDLSPLTPHGFVFDQKERPTATTEITDSTPGELNNADESRPPWQVDSGIGLPEKPGQQTLPFLEEELEEGLGWKEEEEKRKMDKERKEFFSFKEEGTNNYEEAEAIEREAEKPISRPFFQWIKAKLFDLFFVGLLWLIAFVLAARMVSWSFFALVAASTFQAIALFLLLFAGYLFLFRFFIGETLGDRLFSAGD